MSAEDPQATTPSTPVPHPIAQVFWAWVVGIYTFVLFVHLGLVLLAVWWDLKVLTDFWIFGVLRGVIDNWRNGLGDPTFRLFFYASVAAALGSLVEQSQDLHYHFAVRRDFNSRFVSKYLLGPWMAMALAVISYAVLRSGLVVLDGVSLDTKNVGVSAMVSAFALGGLIGFNSRQVSKWLYAQGKRLFPFNEVTVPDLSGKTLAEASDMLKTLGLKATWVGAPDSKTALVERTLPAKDSVVMQDATVKLVLKDEPKPPK